MGDCGPNSGIKVLKGAFGAVDGPVWPASMRHGHGALVNHYNRGPVRGMRLAFVAIFNEFLHGSPHHLRASVGVRMFATHGIGN